MTEVYTPSKSLPQRLRRHAARYVHKRMIAPSLDQPVVSFSFDDCPKSVVTNALPLLEQEGWTSTIYIAAGLCDTVNHMGLQMSLEDVKSAADAGHEIGDHTYHHVDGNAVSVDTYLLDIDKNQRALKDLDIPPSRSFAYPYGTATPALKRALNDRFELARGVIPAGDNQIDLGLSPSTCLYHGPLMDRALGRIQKLATAPRWEILFTHDVRHDPSDYGCTVSDLKNVIQAVKDSGAIVLPVAEALDYVRATA